jgi:hypothetical protein
MCTERRTAMKPRKPKRDRYVHLYVYPDDTPYLVVNPPRNFKALLRKWKRLDDMWSRDEPGGEEWSPIDDWLASKSVTLVEAESLYLEDA